MMEISILMYITLFFLFCIMMSFRTFFASDTKLVYYVLKTSSVFPYNDFLESIYI